MSAPARPGPRQRLLAAAIELTYTHGVDVGVDAILKEADVARRSLYQHFGGKDGLLVEVIRVTAAEDERQYQAALQAGGTDPRRRLLNVFDVLATRVSAPGFHGCRYIAADLAVAAPDHPIHAETREYRRRLQHLLRAELDDLGHTHPAKAAEELLFLIEATLVAGVTRPHTNPARTARRLAEHIIDS
jgi:AcrR family transcriptional regulator